MKQRRPLLTLRGTPIDPPVDWEDRQAGIKAVLNAEFMDIKDFYEYLACNDRFTRVLKDCTASSLSGTHPDSHSLAVVLLQIATRYFIEKGYNDE